MKRLVLLAFSLVAFLPAIASFAFDEPFPEFESLTEPEQAELDSTTELGTEYLSDIYAFSKPANWEHAFLSSRIAVDGLLGSIDAVHFWMGNRIKLDPEINEWFELRFLYFDSRNLEHVAVHTMLQTVFWPARWLGLSLYGEASFHKRENDVGLAILWRPQPNSELRIFQTWVDVTRQKRSDATDKFAEGELPYARGLTVKRWSTTGRDFLELGFRDETPTRWLFADQGYDYRYWRRLVSGWLSEGIAENLRLNVRLQADRKFEANAQTGPTTSQTDLRSVTTSRLLAMPQLELADVPARGWTLIPSILYGHHRWEVSGSTLKFNETLFGAALTAPFGLTLDYSLTVHNEAGDRALFPAGEDRELEQRLDLGYSFRLSRTAEIWLKAGFDVDQLLSRNAWEAGAGFFRWAM